MELETKHLAPYLPYELKLIGETSNSIGGVITREVGIMKGIIHNENKKYTVIMNTNLIWVFKPILRPIPQIRAYFEPIFESDQQVKEFLSYEATSPFSVDEIADYKFEYLPYGTCQVLLKHHFDIFGLIDAGLAIDINKFESR